MIKRANLIDMKREIALHSARRRADSGGFGFGFGVGGRVGKSAGLASLPLTGWWRADYSGTPWTGTPSAGSSGGRDLTDIGSPAGTDTAVNGYTPAAFFGTETLFADGTLTNYVSALAFSGWVLCKLSSNLDDIFGDSNAVVSIYRTTTVKMRLNGTSIVDRAITTGVWQLITFRYDGAHNQIGVNEAPGAAGGSSSGGFGSSLSPLNGNWFTGTGIGAGNMQGDVLEFAFAATALTNQQFADIKAYCNTRYALAL